MHSLWVLVFTPNAVEKFRVHQRQRNTPGGLHPGKIAERECGEDVRDGGEVQC